MSTPDGLVTVLLGGDQIMVKPNTQVWAINLDRPSVPPAITTSGEDGRFVRPIDAAAGDRVRILVRTETEHSPPLDLQVRVVPEQNPPAFVVKPQAIVLACLKLSASETLQLEGSSGTLSLDNQCPTPVQITKAQLRLGDRGITLGDISTPIPPGEEATLTFQDSMGPGAVERLDVLLLDVKADGPTFRYAIDVFSDLE